MVEFDQMKAFDQLRAATKEQMEWLTEVAGKVACKQALDYALPETKQRRPFCSL